MASLPDVSLGGHQVVVDGHDAGGHEDSLAPEMVGPGVAVGGPRRGPQDVANEGATNGAAGGPTATRPGANSGGANTDDAVAPGEGGLPGAELAGDRMTRGERASMAIGFWGRQALKGTVSRITKPGGVYHSQPESLAQHDEYAKSKAWVPDGYDGKWLGPFGMAYHFTFAKFGMATGYAWAWVWARPLRFFPTFTLVFIAVTLIRYG